MVSVEVDEQECTGCGECEDICPRGVFVLKEPSDSGDLKTVSVVSNEDACIMCMACVAVCEISCVSISDPSPEMIL